MTAASDRGHRRAWRSAWAAAMAVAWGLACAAPAQARPGFGVRNGSGSAGPSAPAGGRSSGSAGSARSGAGTVRSEPSRPQPGFGRNPNYRDGTSTRRDRGRERIFDPRRNAGSYGYPNERRSRPNRNRVRPYYSDPFFYVSPYVTPYFSPFGWGYGYYPFGDVFNYSDYYTSPDRRLREERREEREEEDGRWPESARGNVVLDIRPRDVEVRINGALTTKDGRAVLNLPAGTYHVEVTRSGYRPWSTQLVVSQGIQYRLEQRLERLSEEERRASGLGPEPVAQLAGELVLDVTPDDTIAVIDGRLLGVVNLLQGGTALKTLPVGRHRLELRRPGYRTVTREIAIDARAPLRLAVSLAKE